MTDVAQLIAKRDAEAKSVLGGEFAVGKWAAALNALHAFAQASNCPPGGDVISWFDAKTREVQDRYRALQAQQETSEDE